MGNTTYRCPECGHDEISFEGFVAWSDAEQKFEVVDLCDKGHRCANCEHEGYTHDFEVEDEAPDVKTLPSVQSLCVLDLCTAHVTEEDMVSLCGLSSAPDGTIAVAQYVHGAWLGVPSSDNDIETVVAKAGLSKSVARVLRYARAFGAQHVRLDCDVAALDVAELDRHDW